MAIADRVCCGLVRSGGVDGAASRETSGGPMAAVRAASRDSLSLSLDSSLSRLSAAMLPCTRSVSARSSPESTSLADSHNGRGPRSGLSSQYGSTSLLCDAESLESEKGASDCSPSPESVHIALLACSYACTQPRRQMVRPRSDPDTETDGRAYVRVRERRRLGQRHRQRRGWTAGTAGEQSVRRQRAVRRHGGGQSGRCGRLSTWHAVIEVAVWASSEHSGAA